MSETILQIKDLVVDYEVREGILRSVDHVSLDVPRRKITGLVGESGCGKTTLLQGILNILPENGYVRCGKIIFEGTDLLSLNHDERRRILWEDIATIFQAAQSSLNPILTIAEHMIETVQAHRSASKQEIISKGSELLELVGLEPERILKTYPHQLSGGMRQRCIIAMSLLLDPKMILLDEPTTALDLFTQAEIIDSLRKIQEERKNTMIWITHDMATIAKVADRVAVMYAAKIVEVGDVEEIFYNPKHPYTKALIDAVPSILDEVTFKKPIPGLPPSLIHPPTGCRFHPRCFYAEEICSRIEPKLLGKNGHLVACHLWE